MPDFQGNYWFVARYGTVGFVNAQRKVHVDRLVWRGDRELLQHRARGRVHRLGSRAVPLRAHESDWPPNLVWREAYDRGTRSKVGQINRGSGTTPTLLGEDYVAIADNAEPRMNVMVYRRASAEAGPRWCARRRSSRPGRAPPRTP